MTENTKLYNQAVSQIDARIRSLATQERIKSAMNMSLFLNPKNKNVDDSDNDIVNTIAEAYDDDERAHETDEKDVSKPRIKSSEAIQLRERLQLYEKQQIDSDEVLIARLNRYERDTRARGVSQQQQTSISTYFTWKSKQVPA